MTPQNNTADLSIPIEPDNTVAFNNLDEVAPHPVLLPSQLDDHVSNKEMELEKDQASQIYFNIDPLHAQMTDERTRSLIQDLPTDNQEFTKCSDCHQLISKVRIDVCFNIELYNFCYIFE